jgi:NAD(P)-dependent dehydrogenase (short-subunit alcohol dehydrogenase family)
LKKNVKKMSVENTSTTENYDWISRNIPNLSGKVAIVTGANSGTGYEATKELARAGAHVVMGCRNLDKAEAAQTKLQTEIPNASLEIIPLDLADLASVRAFATTFRNRHTKLDILCNNAGIMQVPNKKETVDGFELQLGTNHFGHFALTGLLMEPLMAVNGRIVTMSSVAHSFGNMDFKNLQWDQPDSYSSSRAYGRSKLANLMFTYELHRRLRQSGSRVKAIAAHPGYSRTNLQSTGLNTGHRTIMSRLNRLVYAIMNPLVAQSAHKGALPLLYAATSPDAQCGEYYGPDGFMGMRGFPTVVQSSDASHNEADARQLWELSEQLTGVHYAELASQLLAQSK